MKFLNKSYKSTTFEFTEKLNLPFWTINFKTKEIEYNHYWTKLFEINGHCFEKNLFYWFRFVHPEDINIILKNMKNYLNHKATNYYETFRIITAKGNIKWIEIKSFYTKKENRAFGIALDITDKIKLIKQIKYSAENYKNIINNTDEGILIINQNGIILNANKAIKKITEYTNDEIIGLDFRLLFQDKNILQSITNSRKNKSLKIKTTIITRTKNKIYAEINTKYQKESSTFLLFIKDITRQKSLEEELNNTINIFNNIFDSVPFAILQLEENLTIRNCNQRTLSILKLNHKSDIIGKKMIDFVEDHEKEKLLYLTNNNNKKNSFFIIQLNIQDINCYFEVTISPLNNKAEKTEGYICIMKELDTFNFEDYNSRKSEYYLKKAQELSKISSWDWNIEDDTMFWSETLYDMFSLSKESDVPSFHKLSQLILGKYYENKNLFIKELNEKLSETHFEIKITTSPQNIKWIKCDVAYQFNKGKLKRISGTFQDITEKKSIEQKILNTIVETEDKERKRFAEDLHDELAPILSSIKMYMSLLQSNKFTTEHNDILNHTVNLINIAIESTKEIAEGLMSNVLKDFGLNEAISSYFKSLNKLNKTNFIFENKIGNRRFSGNIERVIFKTTKELSNNTLKYAKAKTATLKLFTEKRKLHFIYTDDGIGFELNEYNNKSGLGIKNIMERIRLMNGMCTINSGKNFGLEVIIEIDI